MKSLLCPISPLRVGESTARLTGLLVAALIGLYAITGAWAIMVAVAIDFGVRTGSRWPYSPLSWLAARLVRIFSLPDRPIDKAPKMFAARVGLLFAMASSILTIVHPLSGVIIGLVLMGFALLESVLNICIGCFVYSHIMLPLFTKRWDA